MPLWKRGQRYSNARLSPLRASREGEEASCLLQEGTWGGGSRTSVRKRRGKLPAHFSAGSHCIALGASNGSLKLFTFQSGNHCSGLPGCSSCPPDKTVFMLFHPSLLSSMHVCRHSCGSQLRASSLRCVQVCGQALVLSPKSYSRFF